MPRIILADACDLVRRGLRQLVEEDGWQFCGEASNGREVVDLASRVRPQVAVVDLGLPGLNGLEAARRIRRASPCTEVLISSQYESEQIFREVLAAGARGYLLKSDRESTFLQAIEALARHKPFFTSRLAEGVLDRFFRTGGSGFERDGMAVLTRREREILQLVAEARSNKEVGAMLGISVKTVETHRAALMRKLRLSSVVELVHFAIRNGWVQP